MAAARIEMLGTPETSLCCCFTFECQCQVGVPLLLALVGLLLRDLEWGFVICIRMALL